MREHYKPDRYRFKGFTNELRDLFYKRLTIIEEPCFLKAESRGVDFKSGEYKWLKSLSHDLIVNKVPPTRGFWAHVVQETLDIIPSDPAERELYKFDVPTCTDCRMSVEHNIKELIADHLTRKMQLSEELYKLRVTGNNRHGPSSARSYKTLLTTTIRLHERSISELGAVLTRLEASRRFL